MPFAPPSELIVHETPHWRINQRVGCSIPGYLMLGAKDSAAVELSDVAPAGLSELGLLQSRATAILRRRCQADRVYISRFGHEPGHTVHFHIIPVYRWLLAAYAATPADQKAARDPDGADLTRFIWREYCEAKPTPPCPGPSIAETVDLLRREFKLP